MIDLSETKAGERVTIQWIFGLPEVISFMKKYDISEGSTIQIIQKITGGIIIGKGNARIAMNDGIAKRIKV